MVRNAGLCLAALMLAGCASSTTLDNAAKLASAGSAAATAAASFVGTAEDDYQAYVDGVAFAAAYPVPAPQGAKSVEACNRYGLTPLSATAQAAAKDYFDQLAKTRSFLAQLGKAYDGFGALASYGARDAVQNGLQGAFTAANGLLTTLHEPTADSGPLIGSLGGIFAQKAQQDAVLEASAHLRSITARVSAALKAHRKDFVDVRREEAKVRWQVADTLWCAGLVDARPLVVSLIPGTGLVASAAPSPADAATKAAVEALLAARSRKTLDDIDAGFDRIIDGLEALVEQHKMLEAGQAVDVGGLAALTSKQAAK